MKVFKLKYQKRKSSEDRLAGFHLDAETDSLLTLWAISQDHNRSGLLREIVESSLSKMRPVDLVAKKANRMYNASHIGESSFITALKNDLRGKSVSEDLIDQVIIRFKELRKKKNA
jgi:hypothetical protein